MPNMPAYLALYTMPVPPMGSQFYECWHIWHWRQCQVCTFPDFPMSAQPREVKMGTSYWWRAQIRGLWLVERTKNKNLRGLPWFWNALSAQLALCRLHKWHCVHYWHCVDCINGIVCTIGIECINGIFTQAKHRCPNCCSKVQQHDQYN